MLPAELLESSTFAIRSTFRPALDTTDGRSRLRTDTDMARGRWAGSVRHRDAVLAESAPYLRLSARRYTCSMRGRLTALRPLTPAELVEAHLRLSPGTISALRKAKSPVI